MTLNIYIVYTYIYIYYINIVHYRTYVVVKVYSSCPAALPYEYGLASPRAQSGTVMCSPENMQADGVSTASPQWQGLRTNTARLQFEPGGNIVISQTFLQFF